MPLVYFFTLLQSISTAMANHISARVSEWGGFFISQVKA
jgi:hypothetical protein